MKLKLNSWFEISELEYTQYRLQGYQIDADKYRVVWYLNGNLHREDGPAAIFANGTQVWFLNNQRHRTDGPAIIWTNGGQEWWLNGKEYTEQEFENEVKQLV
jgi:hypothetical protein